jgi:HAMP domain-containing protein
LKLLLKFNLVLILAFGIGMGLISLGAYNFLMKTAQRTVLEQADLMGASASATKSYTEEQVSPLLEQAAQVSNSFLPQMIPFYAATTTFQNLRKTYPEYTVREVALNPTNLSDRATDWETDLINYFRNHPSERKVIGRRQTPTGELLYAASPIVAEPGCLECHSDPNLAPAAMIRRYGPTNGFGWNANEIVASQIVSVPVSLPVQLAQQGFRNLLFGLGIVFLLTLVMVDLGMYFLVIRPLRVVSENADRISKGEIDLPPIQPKGRDEIAQVTESFNRMHASLIKAFEMLNG